MLSYGKKEGMVGETRQNIEETELVHLHGLGGSLRVSIVHTFPFADFEIL